MSITVSIYDLFAFTIPGIVYLFVLNDLSRILGYKYVDISNPNFTPNWFLLTLSAYLTGQILDYLCHRLWTVLWFRKPIHERAYNKFISLQPGKVSFVSSQWQLLFAVIRREDRSTAEIIDRSIALSVMLRNVSFGLFLFALLRLFVLFTSFVSFVSVAIPVGTLITSVVAMLRSDYYAILYYSTIFQQALLYGNSLSDVLNQKNLKTGERKSPNERSLK